MFCHNCGSNYHDEDIFCVRCGTRKPANQVPLEFDSLRTAITHYFVKGFRYASIVEFLRIYHNMKISIRTLKRRLLDYGLSKKPTISESVLRRIICTEIQGPSSHRGYRGMWNMLRTTYSMSVPRDMVMRILKDVDPTGTTLRKARRLIHRTYVCSGSNAVWHADGYDKLKPYGFPIHGCIDGFSRKVLWLKLCRSNNNPSIIASLFLKVVEELRCRPKLLRTDCGTENGILSALQCTMANNNNAHRYGSSHSNQRIENWWSHNRRCYMNWVINFFKNLVATGKMVLGHVLHMECAWFVFSAFIQTELDRIKHEWNTHYIRRSRQSCVSGVPDELYYLPHLRDYHNAGVSVTSLEINQLLQQRDVHSEASEATDVDDSTLKTLFSVCNIYGWNVASTPKLE